MSALKVKFGSHVGLDINAASLCLLKATA